MALTPKGLEIHDELVGAALERQEILLRDFSPKERKLLSEFIARMRRGVEALGDAED